MKIRQIPIMFMIMRNICIAKIYNMYVCYQYVHLVEQGQISIYHEYIFRSFYANKKGEIS